MATNEFLTWALATGANVESQASYAADAARTNGVVSGTASSALFNKGMRQSAFWASVLASVVVGRTGLDALDDGNVSGMVAKFESAVLDIVSDEGYATVAALSSEASTRASADSALSTAISTETSRAEAAEAAIIASIPAGAMPGAMWMFAGTTAPSGWLECDGRSLLRSGTYASLFAIIGTTFGSADGTHFNIPDMRGMFARGWGAPARDRYRPHIWFAARSHGRPAQAYFPFNDDSGGSSGVTPLGQTATSYSVGGINVTHPHGYAYTNDGTTYNGDNPQNGISTVIGPETRPVNVALMFIIKY